MTSLRALLREIINSRSSQVHPVSLSTSEEPTIFYLQRRSTGTNDDTWELAVHADSDPDSGVRERSSAVLYAYPDYILLEALGSEVYVRPPQWTNPRTTRDMSVRLQPSTEFTRDRVHLRPGDRFGIGSALFEFEYHKGEDVQVASSAISDTAVVDLEEKDPDARTLHLPEDESFVSTPFPSRSMNTTIQDTPSMPSRHCNPVELADHLIGEIAGNAIQGNEDSQNWSPDISKREILGTIRDAQRRSLPRSQESKKMHSPGLQSRSAISVWEDTDAAGSSTDDLLPGKKSSTDIPRSSAVISSKGESIDLLPETELAPQAPPNGLRGLDANNNVTSFTTSERSNIGVEGDESRSEPAEQDSIEPMSRPDLLQQHAEQTHPLASATASDTRGPEESPQRISAEVSDGEEQDGFSDHARINRAENLLVEACTDAASLPETNVPIVESNKFRSPLLATVSDDVPGQPTKDVVPPNMSDRVEFKQMSLNPINLDKVAVPTFEPMHPTEVVMPDIYATEEDAQALASDAEDTQESTHRRSVYLLKVAVDSQALNSSQTDGLPVPDVDDPQQYQEEDMEEPIEAMTEARIEREPPSVGTSSTLGKGNTLRLSKSKRKLSDGDMSNIGTPVKAAKIPKIHDPSNSQDSNGSTIVIRTSALRSARGRGPAKSQPLSEQVGASPARTRASASLSQSSNTEFKPRILFASSTNIDTTPRYMSFLQRHSAVKVESIRRCNLLCVGKGKELKRTSKLIQAIASGIDIVTDEWILQSVKDGRLLDPLAFLAEDPEREAEWGITLTEAVRRGKQGRKPLQDWTILFTPTLKRELGKGFTELKEIATHAGAKTVRAAVPRKKSSEMEKTLLLAAERDENLPFLHQNRWRCYSKDLLTLSVLRGVLDPEGDEFLLSVNEGG